MERKKKNLQISLDDRFKVLKCCVSKPIHFKNNDSFITTVKQLLHQINKPLKKLHDTLNQI